MCGINCHDSQIKQKFLVMQPVQTSNMVCWKTIMIKSTIKIHLGFNNKKIFFTTGGRKCFTFRDNS